MMNTLRTILLIAALLTVLVASAQTNAQTRRQTTTTPPGAPTTRGPNDTHRTTPGTPGTVQRTPQHEQNRWADRDGRDRRHDYDRDRRGDWDCDRRDGYERDRREWDGDDRHDYDRSHDGRNPLHRPYLPPEWNRPYQGRYEGRWRYMPLLTTILRAFTQSKPDLWGAVIVAPDDTFLGVISKDRNDEDSITNGWGRFGSPQSPWSIWNPEGRWGSAWGPQSPWNPCATRPPKVYQGNAFRGYLTTNPKLHPRIDPEWLRKYLNVPRW